MTVAVFFFNRAFVRSMVLHVVRVGTFFYVIVIIQTHSTSLDGGVLLLHHVQSVNYCRCSYVRFLNFVFVKYEVFFPSHYFHFRLWPND